MTPEEQMKFEKNKNIQEMLNDFLLEQHKMTMSDFLKKKEQEHEVLGVITATHKIMLQQMVKNKYPNIDELIKNKNENTGNNEQKIGFITMVEWELIEDLLNIYLEEKSKGAIPDVEYLVESVAKVA